MPKKKTIETHGQVESTKPKLVPTLLEQTWGDHNQLSRYGTTEESVYRSQVLDMNRTDLEAHARKLGVVILESTARLQEKLVHEFLAYVASVRGPGEVITGSVAKPNAKPTDEVRKILAEGR